MGLYNKSERLFRPKSLIGKAHQLIRVAADERKLEPVDPAEVVGEGDGGSVTPVYEELTATDGQTTFSFTLVPTDIKKYMVYVNGAGIPKRLYSVSGNDIIFTAGLKEDDSVMLQGVQ